jgi:hypothetical protein
VHATGRNLLFRLNPGPKQASLQGLRCRIHEDNNLRSLEFLCENRIKLVKGPQDNSCFSSEVTRELFEDVWPNPVIPSVGISVADNPSQSGLRAVCRHESIPLEFRHEPLLLVKDLNQQGHLTQSMG